MRTSSAIVRELEHRDQIDRAQAPLIDDRRLSQPPSSHNRAQAPMGREQHSEIFVERMYPVQYAVDVAPIESRMNEENMGLRRPTRKDELTAVMVNTQNRGYLVSVRQI